MVLGDKIAIMDQGKLVQIGRPEEVYLHPQNDFARDFLGISNQLPICEETIYVVDQKNSNLWIMVL